MSYARVTLSAPGRNVEMLLPGDVPIGQLMPEILSRFEPANASTPSIRTLTIDGKGTLPWTSTLDAAGIADGSVVRITDRADAYPAPIVYDVIDETALTKPNGVVWPVGRGRSIGAAVLAAVLGWPAAQLLTAQHTPRSAGHIMWVAALVAAVVAGAFDNRRVGIAVPLLTLSATCAIESGIVASWQTPSVLRSTLAACAVVVAAWFTANRQWRHLALASASMAATAVFWLIGSRAQHGVHASAIAGVLTLVLLGYLPRLALSVSGLARLDDRALRGEPVHRSLAVQAIDAAHHGLVAGVATCALSAWLAVRGLCDGANPNAWAIGLSVIIVSLLALRSRNMPLVQERSVLLLAAGLCLVAIARRVLVWRPDAVNTAGGVLAACAVLAAASLLLRLPDHAWARLRVIAGRCESVATVAMVPVAVGVFGVYGHLATVFQR